MAGARRGRLLPALAIFACACAFIVQMPGWAQTSYMSLTRALDSGTAQVDRWHWQTHDIAWYDGHYYSVKPPGLPLATLPLYAAMKQLGAERLARRARLRAEATGRAPWTQSRPPVENYGYDLRRTIAARAAIAESAPILWVLGLLGVLLPAVGLLVLVARMTNRVAPGTGTATALTLAVGTMILPFSTLYFSHVLSALLAFAAFALVWREREQPSWRPRTLAIAGLLAGLAVLCEYPLAIAALIVGAYAISRREGGLARRATAYGAGLAAGVAPLLAYQWWAFGSPLHTTYTGAVADTGRSGHAVLGLNDAGIFGITMPRPGDALSLLFGGRGLLILAPVLVMAIAGVVMMHRAGRRAEARTIGAIAIAYLVYNAGYWLPFGGGSPGPRFLIPILPFLAIGLGMAWRRWPAVTLSLAAISATTMITATMSYPMIGMQDAGEWVRRMLDHGLFQYTLMNVFVDQGVITILPFAVLAGTALALGVSSLGRAHLAIGARHAPLAIGAWVLCAIVLPHPFELPSGGAMILFAAAAIVALAVVACTALTGRRDPSAQHEEHRSSAPLALEVQSAQRSG
jgi:hypothetical protein